MYKEEADAFFNRGKYANAKLRYQEALNQKPGDFYVTNKINACNQKIMAQPNEVEREKLYLASIDAGDKFFNQGEYANAKLKYLEASTQWPDDGYVTDRIKNCDLKIAEQAKEVEREKLYVQYKYEGNTFFDHSEYAKAKIKYQAALAQKPEEGYLVDRIKVCDQKIAEQKADIEREKFYTQHRDAGDASFKQGEYAEAKGYYKLALSYKLENQYVTERIHLCDSLIAAAAPSDMVYIHGGYFMMGSEDGESDEKPVHKIYVDDFYMDKYEVTVERYVQFLKANPSQTKPNYWNEQLQNPNHPVVYVSWENAKDYADWADKKLPTEAQWEYAARGGLEGKTYPWGNDSPEGKANYGQFSSDWAKYLRNVGSYSVNGYGLYDMAGNVWEWCGDWYNESYYQNHPDPDRNPKGPSQGIQRVLRGGSWNYVANYLRCAFRSRYFPTDRYYYVGFRCLLDVR